MANRRSFLRKLAAAGALLTAPASFGAELLRTPRQTPGPFYPDKLPLDDDNDLVTVDGAAASALGEVTRLSGRILDTRGEPLKNAVVEIWQVDSHGIYLHRDGGDADRRDSRFQGFGRFETSANGEYLFRTIKPVPYPGRAPHIHFAVKLKGREQFTTQCYVEGDPLNARDFVLNSVRDPQARASLIVPFVAVPGSTELAARFDIVLGATPAA